MMLCKTAKPEKPEKIHTRDSDSSPIWSSSLTKKDAVALFGTIQDISDEWDAFAPEGDLFLNSRYFHFLESNPPTGFQFGYLLFYREGYPTGIAYCQWVNFSGAKHLDLSPLPQWRQWILKRISISILVCGNMMLTGHSGYAFSQEIPREEQAQLLGKALDLLMMDRNVPQRKASIWVIKDVPQSNSDCFDALPSCTGFHIQPGMAIHFDPDWKSFDDYLGALTSKYRVRAKRAARKMKGIDTLPLNAARHNIFRKDIHQLYREVAYHSGFNIVELPEAYFAQMSEHFEDDFSAKAFVADGEIIGFYTLVRSAPNNLDAHYLGFNGQENRKRQLYLNMLFDMIKTGIGMKVRRINFSRTALEIKSSVGARPEQFKLYTKHRCMLINALFPFSFQKFVPPHVWEERHPFGK